MKPKNHETVGHARTLLTRAARRPVVKEVCRVKSARAIQIIREALRGRSATSQISTWLSEVISFIACRHPGACGYTTRATCRACACFLCLRRTAR